MRRSTISALRLAFALYLSVVAHVTALIWYLIAYVIVALVLIFGGPQMWWEPGPLRIPVDRLELVDLSDRADPDDDPTDDDPDEPEPEKPEEKFDGQIVELPPDVDPERPEKADYLAETDHTVEKETRSERYEVNPEVLSDRWSPEQAIAMVGENVEDLDLTRPSTGAQVGAETPTAFDPSQHGMLAATQSKWKVTNRDGLADPVPASSLVTVLAGAPQNDRLDEEKGATTSLNTKEFLYASYLLRVRRLVNFYWNQNLDNLPNSVKLVRPEYTTRVTAVLDASGSLDSVELTGDSGGSGSPELDDAVLRAFKVAGPYPNPPAGLVSADGRVYLPDMGFTVTLGVAEMRYDGVDPRAGVQFPGILKSPR